MRIEHPYAQLNQPGRWLCGNLHAHTTVSDGRRDRQAVVDDYAERGHGFLMLSDHDVFTSAEDHAGLKARGMVLIPGNEISAGGPHLLHVFGTRRIEPHPDRQRVIDEVAADRGFIVINHPRWQQRFAHCPQELMEQWSGYAGLEIYNGTIGRLDGSPYSTDRWDMLLSAGRRAWGFANDDSHLPVEDVGLGWNGAYVHDLSPEGVVDALAAGRFYASTGVVISQIEVEGSRIRIKTENAQRIVALREVGRRIQVVDEKAIEVEVPPQAKYVRFECWGAGESFAWTQPFFISE
jgi:hypothetical protein